MPHSLGHENSALNNLSQSSTASPTISPHNLNVSANKDRSWMQVFSNQDKNIMKEALADLHAVDELLKTAVETEESLPRDLAARLLSAGGKRIRPFLMCLSYQSLSQTNTSSSTSSNPRADRKSLHKLGSVAELVHTATLFHDDVLDFSPTRRDIPAAHMTHGNKNAILVGDFVYAEAFYILMKDGLIEPSRKLAKTIKTVVEGELRQHLASQNRDLTLKSYEHIARAKTAALFAWCTETGAWVAGSELYHEAHSFGDALGYAFQMADDLIDTFELNTQLATELEILQWLDSAAPLPLVMLHERGSKPTNNLWTSALKTDSTEERRHSIQKLQELARNPELLENCLNMVDVELKRAKESLIKLNAVADLEWSLDAIWDRAIEGIQLSGFAKSMANKFPQYRSLSNDLKSTGHSS